MDNQHQKIKGYRDLSQAEIDLMNEIKAKGQELKALTEKVMSHVSGQYDAAYGASDLDPLNEEEFQRLAEAEPHKWLEHAGDEPQVAIMKLVRAVAQPTTF